MAALLRAALVLLAGIVGVEAGSWSFQPRLEAPRLRSLRSNATHHHTKRWVGTAHGGGAHMTRLWPNKNINYAFSDQNDAEARLAEGLHQAIQIWDDMTFRETSLLG